MPISLISVFVSAVSVYVFGALYYGWAFAKTFQQETGITENSEGAGTPQWMAAGFVIELVKSLGVAWLLAGQRLDAAAALEFGVKLGVLFGVSGTAYAFVYSLKHNATLFALDGAYSLATFAISAVVVALVDARLATVSRARAAASNKSPSAVTKRTGRSRSPARR